MIRRALRLPGSLLAENAGLVAIAIFLLALRPLLGPYHALARPDLLPWLALTLAMAGVLRRGGWGLGPAPGLPPRRDLRGAISDRLARASAPFSLLLVHDAVGRDPESMISAGLGVAGTLVLHRFGLRDGKTAWDPPGPSDGMLTGLAVLGTLVPVSVSALFALVLRGTAWMAELDAAVFTGTAFFAVGLVSGHPSAFRQRLRLARRRGAGGLPVFRPALALFGTPLGLLPLLLIFSGLGSLRLDVAAAHVLVWAAVLWPRRPELLRPCLLREVRPAGGRDPALRQTAGFDAPPEGALRLQPLVVRENQIVHIWVVPVRDARLERLDDPVDVPWPRSSLAAQAHVLGQASFEPEPGSLRQQIDEITVRVQASTDTIALRVGDAATRRLVILRPYVPLGQSSRRVLGAYRWDDGVPLLCRQVVDGNTTRVTLRDGDLIIASSEGVSRAYELCFGAPSQRELSSTGGRTPQIEDYVGRQG